MTVVSGESKSLTIRGKLVARVDVEPIIGELLDHLDGIGRQVLKELKGQ